MENKKEKEENKESEANLKAFMERVFKKNSNEEYIAKSMAMDLDEDSFAVEKSLLKLQK